VWHDAICVVYLRREHYGSECLRSIARSAVAAVIRIERWDRDGTVVGGGRPLPPAFMTNPPYEAAPVPTPTPAPTAATSPPVTEPPPRGQDTIPPSVPHIVKSSEECLQTHQLTTGNYCRQRIIRVTFDDGHTVERREICNSIDITGPVCLSWIPWKPGMTYGQSDPLGFVHRASFPPITKAPARRRTVPGTAR
jgi:hypothetical protein